MARDYYAVLGVPRDATQEEIRRAYRRRAHELHPDKGGDAEKMKELNEAYEVLGNPEKRRQYDMLGTAASAGEGGFGFDPRSFGWQEMDWNLGSIFETFFGGETARRTGPAPQRGTDITVDAELSLEEVCRGAMRNYRLDKEIVCPRCRGQRAEPGAGWAACGACGGKGFEERVSHSFFARFVRRQTCTNCKGRGEVPRQQCRTCRGEGKVRREIDVEVKIPPGVEDGQTVRIPGKGNAGSDGGEPGDLFVAVHVKKGRWRRRGKQLIFDLKIPFTTAVLGGKVKVPTLEGEREISIKPGTAGGERIVLPGLGLPPAGGGARGDLVLRVQIGVPARVSRRQRRLLEQLRRESGAAL